ncbi:hypothetical protein ACJZ2D_001699 [Fusarium nematophilum]
MKHLGSPLGSRTGVTNPCISEQPVDPEKLTVRGAIIDRVTRTCPRWILQGAQQFPDLAIGAIGSIEAALLIVHHITRAANELEGSHGVYPNGDDFSTAIWQTLMCGLGWGGERRANPSDHIHYNAFLNRYRDALQEMQSNGGQVPTMLGGRILRNEQDARQALERLEAQEIQIYLPTPGRNETPQEELQLEEQLYPFLSMVLNYQCGRRTCVTSNCHLGTVPAETEEGDVIAMFFGLGVPFVLRPIGGGEFRLIGHCYVHGVMDGELVESDHNTGDIRPSTLFPTSNPLNPRLNLPPLPLPMPIQHPEIKLGARLPPLDIPPKDPSRRRLKQRPLYQLIIKIAPSLLRLTPNLHDPPALLSLQETRARERR